MVGLGVGIDYALFQVTRFRQALAAGREPRDAVLVTAASAGASAAFAGATVAVAICALAISGIMFIAWLGFSAALVVGIVVASSLTFTPALLMVLAPRLMPSGRAMKAGAGTARLAAAVVRHPWAIGTAAVVVLGVLALPAASLSLSLPDPSENAEGSQMRTSAQLSSRHFGEGATAEFVVAAALDHDAAGPDDPILLELGQALITTTALRITPLVPRADDPSVAVAKVTPVEGVNAESTSELLDELRALPTPSGTELHVGGAVATRIDLDERVIGRLPWVVAAVVAASTLVLVFAFRSIAIPIKAAVLNLLSVAAAYGVIVAVFQWGWGAEFLGIDGSVAIESFVPMLLFTVLFGLSTDYEVFLVSSMREVWDRTGDASTAVIEGMRNSGRVITTAALIMISVFASFVLDDNTTVKILGLGLAVSILLDATVIRLMLAPAAMALLGERAWWCPAWLERVLPTGGPPGAEEPTRSTS